LSRGECSDPPRCTAGDRDDEREEELFDVVDEKDNVVARSHARECVTRGLLHRAVVVFLRNSAGEFLLQRRMSRASWYPDHWSASCTGHARSGEDYARAAEREIQEELGLRCSVSFDFKFLSPKWRYGKLLEWEYVGVLEGTIPPGQKITFNEEVKEAKFASAEGLDNWIMSRPEDFTPDTLMAYEGYARAKSGRPLPR
jgi:isopentenyl-diphosphate delta-isomerase type 1